MKTANLLPKGLIAVGAATAISLGMSAPAQALTFTWQDNSGYNWGSGTVSGNDNNGDNLLTLDEVTYFSVNPTFSHINVSLANLVGFGTFDILANVWNANGLSWTGYEDNAWFTWNPGFGNLSINSVRYRIGVTSPANTVPVPAPADVPTPAAVLPVLGGLLAAARPRKNGQTEEA